MVHAKAVELSGGGTIPTLDDGGLWGHIVVIKLRFRPNSVDGRTVKDGCGERFEDADGRPSI